MEGSWLTLCLLRLVDGGGAFVHVYPDEYQISRASRIATEIIGKSRIHQIAAGMRADERSQRIALHVAIFHDQVIAGRHELMKVFQYRRDVVVSVLDHKPRMRFRAQEAVIERVFRDLRSRFDRK